MLSSSSTTKHWKPVIQQIAGRRGGESNTSRWPPQGICRPVAYHPDLRRLRSTGKAVHN
jgi:hypothetical protein